LLRCAVSGGEEAQLVTTPMVFFASRATLVGSVLGDRSKRRMNETVGDQRFRTALKARRNHNNLDFSIHMGHGVHDRRASHPCVGEYCCHVRLHLHTAPEDITAYRSAERDS
jgi:hypothetical protein